MYSLGESGVVKLENFNPFYGNNEDGKPSLSKMVNFLLGKRAKFSRASTGFAPAGRVFAT